VLDDIARLRAAGIPNLNLDLIAGLPHQTEASWTTSLEEVIATGVPHVSVYMLEVDEDSRLGRELIAGGTRYHAHFVPDEDAIADLYVEACRRLNAAGVAQYEISNFGVPGALSRHNLKYWTDGEWIGFGPGAHSTIDGMRTRNVSSTSDYVEAVGPGGALVADARRLSRRERMEEALFTGLRLSDGLSVEWVRAHYGIDLWAEFGAELQPFRDLGWLIYDEGRLRLTRAGMLLAHEIMAVFIRPTQEG
jgi:oxygen-independent coproporphyrinogen-3 oxidase